MQAAVTKTVKAAEEAGTIRYQGRGNTKLGRSFCFTLNNWTQSEYDTILAYFKSHKSQYIIGKEVGTKGTAHLQGYVRFAKSQKWDKIKEVCTRAHLEKAKGSIEQNYTYCSKDNNFTTNITNIRISTERLMRIVLDAEYKDVEWHSWQRHVLNTIELKPDKRKINFIIDYKGNTGKSYLCKYIAIVHDVILATGKSQDIFHAIKTFIEAKGRHPSIFLIDVPRYNVGYLNYGTIEQLKNGFIFSGKYEGGQFIFPIPHIFIFMNEMPDLTTLSEDRYDITQLNTSV